MKFSLNKSYHNALTITAIVLLFLSCTSYAKNNLHLPIQNVMNSISPTPKITEKVTLEGSSIYYEVYGKGEPLFLLHAFTQSSISWLPFVNEYVSDYEVYLVDLKGHGKSGLFTEKVSVKSAAEDLKALIEYLNLDRIKAIGYSYGGEILFQLALLDPELIKSMIIVGSCGTWNAKDFPDFVEYLSYKNINNLPWIREQQTSEEQVISILNQVPNYAITLSEEELKGIKTTTLLVTGDKDPATPLKCVLKTKNNLPDAYLWVVPNTEHGAHKDENKEEFIRISKEFLSDHWKK